MTAAAASLQSLPFGSVVTWDVEPGAYCSAHERETRAHFARRLATLKGYAYAGDCGGRAGPSLRADAPRTYGGHVYFVPSGTVTDPVRARAMGIAGADDLFGGVVEFAFVATKAITHPLSDAGAARPAGWSTHFGHAVAGAVRVKPVRATGGRGQTVAHDTAELDRQLEALDAGELAAHGVVLEENLRDPDTFSVGQVVVDELTVSYHGRQRMTRDNAGLAVYGGSDLMLARGGFDDLLAARDLSAPLRAAIDQARRYHQAVRDGFPASSPRASTTTWRRAAMLRATGARACSSSRGASAVPPVRRSRRWRSSAARPNAGRCGPRPSRSTARPWCRPRPSWRTAAKTPNSGRSPSTP